MSAVMAVMRKMVTVGTHLIQTGEDYDSRLLFPPRPGQAEVSRPTRSGLGRALCAFKPSVVLGGLTNSMASVEKVQIISSFYVWHAKFERRRQSECEIYSSREHFFNRLDRFLTQADLFFHSRSA